MPLYKSVTLNGIPIQTLTMITDYRAMPGLLSHGTDV